MIDDYDLNDDSLYQEATGWLADCLKSQADSYAEKWRNINANT